MPEDRSDLPFSTILYGKGSPDHSDGKIIDPRVAQQTFNDLQAGAKQAGRDSVSYFDELGENDLIIAQAARFVQAEGKQVETVKKLQEETQKKRQNEKWGTLNESAYEEDLRDFVGAALTDESFRSSQPGLATRHVIKFDMQMLNYFNSLSGGHSTGDEYKRFVADTLTRRTERMKTSNIFEGVEYQVYCSTTGGDEFSILAIGNIEKVRKITEMFKEEISKYIHPEDVLRASGVDYGIATLSDIVEGFRNDEHVKPLLKHTLAGKSKMIAYLAENIADRKSEMNKFMSRFVLLHRIYHQSRPEFDSAYSFATKGAFQIFRDRLLAIIQSEDLATDAKVFINEVFSARDKWGLARTDDPLIRILYSLLSKLRS